MARISPPLVPCSILITRTAACPDNDRAPVGLNQPIDVGRARRPDARTASSDDLTVANVRGIPYLGEIMWK